MVDLLDYGFNNVKTEVLKRKGEVVSKININHGDKKVLKVGVKNDLIAYMDIDNSNMYRYEYKYNDVFLPIKTGSDLGKILVYYNNILINTGDLVALEDVNKVSFIQLCKESIVDLLFGNL